MGFASQLSPTTPFVNLRGERILKTARKHGVAQESTCGMQAAERAERGRLSISGPLPVKWLMSVRR